MTFADDNPILFASCGSGLRLSDCLDQQKELAKRLINGIPRDQFLSTAEETLVEHAVGEHVVEALQVFRDAMVMDPAEVQIDVTNRRGEERPIAS